MVIATLDVQYDDGNFKPDTYEGIRVHLNEGEDKVFHSGDLVKDWWRAMKFALESCDPEGHIMYSSSVNHFQGDGGKFDSGYLHVAEGEAPVLKYGNEYWSDRAMEVFVDEGERPTWKELCDYCKDES